MKVKLKQWGYKNTKSLKKLKKGESKTKVWVKKKNDQKR